MRVFVLLVALCVTLPSALGQVPPFAGFETQSLDESTGYGDAFGFSMDSDGERLIVGMPRIWAQSPTDPGVAVVYVKFGQLWQLEAVLEAPSAGIGARVGYAVALSGDTAVVGADEAHNEGRAYVFVRSGPSWSLQATLAPNDVADNARFGQGVAIDGDVIVVGDPHVDAGATDFGAAYVYERSGSSWSQVAKLEASPGAQHDYFGEDVAIEGATILASVRRDDDLAGSVYAFEKVAGTWTQVQKLVPQATTPGGEFGTRLALDGDTACITADKDASSTSTAGVVTIFNRVGGVWVEGQRLTSPEEDGGYGFGFDVDLRDGLLAVAEAGGETRGLAHVYFESAPGLWEHETTMQPAASEPGDTTGGLPVSLGPGPCVTLGAAGTEDLSGVVYAFELLPIGSWTASGVGISGQAGVPSLAGIGPLVSGTPTLVELTDARPLAVSPLVAGAATLQAPFKGGVLYPSPDLILYMFTDFQGEADLAFLWPPGIPSGVSIYLQWWVQDPSGPVGYAATAGLAATAP